MTSRDLIFPQNEKKLAQYQLGSSSAIASCWDLKDLLSYILLRGRTRDVLDVNSVGRHNGVGGGTGVICFE